MGPAAASTCLTAAPVLCRDMDEVLRGGYYSAPIRRGSVVERRTGPWSPNVHALLRHFEQVGFSQAPRVVGVNGDRETLTYVDGEAGVYPLAAAQRSDDALIEVAHTMRAMHDASAGFVAPDPTTWQSRVSVPDAIDCIGHNDVGPYNVVFDGSRVVALIDWDFAGPSSRAWDLCYAAHRFVPLSAPRSTRAFGWDPLPDQPSRLRAFAAAYDMDIPVPYLVDLVIVRLSSIAANIEHEIQRGNPAFDRHRDERHCDGYREDMQYILDNRTRLISAT